MRLIRQSAPVRRCGLSRLNLGASPTVLAAMLVLQPQAAQAQAFEGAPTVILGDVSRGTSGNTDFFTVNALQNTINWVPTDTGSGPAPINFLPAGATASFSAGSGINGANYTVLNRIIAADPSRAIQFAGLVNSDAAGQIWFYAPGGLLISGTAQFNVGSLLLTANDPVGAAAGQPYLDATNSFRLQAAANSTAGINVQAGAQMNAVSPNSYVIAVAPRFDMGGAINVNGSAALAAVGDVSFTLNGGLFDITANLGSASGATSRVTGSITGPAGISGQGEHHRIYMMAVPRNDAMTLLITGGAQLGFAIAGAVDVAGNAVVLSGGYDIRGTAAGSGLGQFGAAPVAGSVGAARILVSAANFTSNVTVRSKDFAEIVADTGAITTRVDLDVYGDRLASVGAAAGNLLSVGRSLLVDASSYASAGNGANRLAGNALLLVQDGSTVDVQAQTVMRANATGDDASAAGQVGGIGTGGELMVTLTGGTMTANLLTLSAVGNGGDSVGRGGAGNGGSIIVALSGGAQLTVDSMQLSAGGFAGGTQNGGTGGAGTGGTITVTTAGTGTRLSASTGSFLVDSNGGRTQAGGQGGDSISGTAELLVSTGGTAIFSGGFLMNGDALGGSVFGDGTGNGGAATAGTLRALVDGAGPGTLTLAPATGRLTRFQSDAFGGVVLDQAGSGGAALGGNIRVGSTGNGGTVTIGELNASANAEGGYGGTSATPGDGGAAQGGSIDIGMGRDASAATPGSFTMASARLDTTAEGGLAGNVGARGGSAIGGNIRLIVNGASGIITGGVGLFSFTESPGFGLPAAAVGGRFELGVGDAANGSAPGTLTIGGVTELLHRTLSPAGPITQGVTRVFATGAGSRLALQDVFSASNSLTGAGARGAADRSGIVAGLGAQIDFTGNVTFTDRRDIGFNDGGTITATGEMFIASGGRVLASFDTPTAGATGNVVTSKLEILGSGGIDIATNTVGSTDVILSSPGDVRVIGIDANRDVTITGTGAVAFTSLRADRTLGVFGDAAITGGSASAGGRLTVQSDASIVVGALDAGTIDPAAGETPNIYVRGLGPVTTGAVASSGDIGLLAEGALTSGALTSGRDLVLLAGGAINTGAITAPATGRVRLDAFSQRSLIVFANGVPDYTGLLAAAPTAVPGNITIGGAVTAGLFEARTAGILQITGAINSAIGTRLNAGSLRLAGLNSQGFVDLFSLGNLVLGDLAAPGAIAVASDGSITIGNINAGDSLVLAADQPLRSVTTGNVRAAGEIRLSANNVVTTGTLSAGNRVFLNAGGGILTGAIDAGTVNPQQEAAGVVFATTPGVIRSGAINVSGTATLSGTAGVTTGPIVAQTGIVLLDTGGITTGSLSTSSSGFVYIAAQDLLPQITFDQAGNPLFAALLASTPVRLVGDIMIGGAARTGRFIAAATGNFAAQAITAPSGVLIDVRGVATLNGSMTAPDITITSRDIVIDTGAVIGGAGAQNVQLIVGSVADASVIGGAGSIVPDTYSLSNAEFGTLRASSITVRSDGAPMTVEQLTLSAIAPGQAANPGVTLQTDGLLRVTGAVLMAQAGAESRLNLIAGTRIEVVQDSGSIQLGADPENPAGTLSLSAQQVRVATAALLSQIAGGTLSGDARVAALNAAPTSGGGVAGRIGAGAIRISASNDVLIQNSGAAAQRAGFTAGTGGLTVTRTGSGLLDLVVNGRVLVAGTGFAVNETTVGRVTYAPGVAAFTPTSTVNGCVVGVACQAGPPPPPPPPPPKPKPEVISQPVLTIVNNIQALTPEEVAKREAARAATERLPIVQLQRLIDLGPMFADPDATDPVTSGGNPALWLDTGPSGTPAPGGQK